MAATAKVSSDVKRIFALLLSRISFNQLISPCFYSQEGGELLDGEELGKTRGETEKQKEETNGAEHNGEGESHEEEEEEKPALKKAGTMEVTAKVLSKTNQV